jgi:hypothetical protein
MEARAGRDDAKRSLAANVDPSAIKRAAKIASGNTFEIVALEWHENWKGARTREIITCQSAWRNSRRDQR